jgi:hypothetical protein
MEFDKDVTDLAERVSKESGIPPKQLLDGLEANVQRVARMRKSDAGKFTVIGIDKFDGEDWIHRTYDTADEAITEARKKTKAAMKSASDPSVATVYYAYDPQGNYLGGDVWAKE